MIHFPGTGLKSCLFSNDASTKRGCQELGSPSPVFPTCSIVLFSKGPMNPEEVGDPVTQPLSVSFVTLAGPFLSPAHMDRNRKPGG